MAKCWRCGSPVRNLSYTCSSCEGLIRIKDLQKRVDSYHSDITKKMYYIEKVKQDLFFELQDSLYSKMSQIGEEIGESLSKIASAIRWGFEEINWSLQCQTNILLSIDHTLKTPTLTKANELRQIAEELNQRGVLDKSEEFFLKAIKLNPLDYRSYIGLAQTYLQLNKFDNAKIFLEKSLPYAPKGEIDYKSYSYRLIGHIYESEEDYYKAMNALNTAIELSPGYSDAHYDYAQYCAQAGLLELCLSSLEKAILIKPMYWYLAKIEQNFSSFRNEVDNFLSKISVKAYKEAKETINKSEITLHEVEVSVKKTREEAWKEVLVAEEALDKSKEKGALRSKNMYNSTLEKYQLAIKDAKAKLESAKDKVESRDYISLLEGKPIAEKSIEIATTAGKEAKKSFKEICVIAKEECDYHEKKHADKVRDIWRMVPRVLIIRPLLFGIVAGIGGCTVGLFPGLSSGLLFDIGFLLGIILGIWIGIYEIKEEIK